MALRKNVLSVGHESCSKQRVGTYQTVGSSKRAQRDDPHEVWMLQLVHYHEQIEVRHWISCLCNEATDLPVLFWDIHQLISDQYHLDSLAAAAAQSMPSACMLCVVLCDCVQHRKAGAYCRRML